MTSPLPVANRPRPAGSTRRAAIVNAAARLMGRRGFEATSVGDIGQAVGMSAAGLYRHFPNKASVLEAVILDMLGELVEVIETGAEPNRSVSAVQEVFITFVLDHPDHVATYLRERGRLGGEAGNVQTKLESAFFSLQGHALAMAADTPPSTTDDPLMRLRIAASFGAAQAHISNNVGLHRPALDRFLSAALTPVVTARLCAVEPESAKPVDKGWTVDSPRRRILENALPLFTTHGFGGVGVAEVGEAAGVAGPNIYRYFDSKIDILVDSFDRVGQRVMTGLDDAVSSSQNADEALSAIVASYVHAAYDNVDLIVVMDQERSSLPASERPRLRRRAAFFGETWRSIIAQCRPDLSSVEVNTMARAATSMVNTCCRQQPIATPQDVAVLAESFLRGRPVEATDRIETTETASNE